MFQKLFAYVSVLEGGLGELLGVDGSWLPLPTRPQQYCDPALLVETSESPTCMGLPSMKKSKSKPAQ